MATESQLIKSDVQTPRNRNSTTSKNRFSAQYPCPLCSTKSSCPFCRGKVTHYAPAQPPPNPCCRCESPRIDQPKAQKHRTRGPMICTPHGDEPPPCCYSWLANIAEQFRLKHALTTDEKQHIQDLYATPCSSKNQCDINECGCPRTYQNRGNDRKHRQKCYRINRGKEYRECCECRASSSNYSTSSECRCVHHSEQPDCDDCCKHRTGRRFFLVRKSTKCKVCKETKRRRQCTPRSISEDSSACQEIDIPCNNRDKKLQSIIVEFPMQKDRKCCNCRGSDEDDKKVAPFLKLLAQALNEAAQKCINNHQEGETETITKTHSQMSNKDGNVKHIHMATATDDVLMRKNEDIFVTLRELLSSCLQQQTSTNKFQAALEKILNSDKHMNVHDSYVTHLNEPQNNQTFSTGAPPTIQSSYSFNQNLQPNYNRSNETKSPLWPTFFSKKKLPEETTTAAPRKKFDVNYKFHGLTARTSSISKMWRRSKPTKLELKWYATGAELKRICGLLNALAASFESPSPIRTTATNQSTCKCASAEQGCAPLKQSCACKSAQKRDVTSKCGNASQLRDVQLSCGCNQSPTKNYKTWTNFQKVAPSVHQPHEARVIPEIETDHFEPLQFSNTDLSEILNPHSLITTNTKKLIPSSAKLDNEIEDDASRSVDLNDENIDSDSITNLLNQPVSSNEQNVEYPKVFDLLKNCQRTSHSSSPRKMHIGKEHKDGLSVKKTWKH